MNKITIVLEEVDETELWIELAKRRALVSEVLVQNLQAEAIELAKIFNATRVMAKNHKS